MSPVWCKGCHQFIHPPRHGGGGFMIWRYKIYDFRCSDFRMVKLRGTEDLPFYFGASPELLKIAWELRKNTTPAEKVLWEKLRRKQMMGYRFRRQHPVWQFVVDFFCYETMLAIEIDGAVHEYSYQGGGPASFFCFLKQKCLI